METQGKGWPDGPQGSNAYLLSYVRKVDFINVYCFLQISRFTEIMLEKDTDEEYKYFRVEENPARPTLLHLAAEQNFLHVTKLLVEKYPTLVYLETEVVGDYERGYLPVEKALMSYKDETAAYLISQMKHDWWVDTIVHEVYIMYVSQGGYFGL